MAKKRTVVTLPKSTAAKNTRLTCSNHLLPQRGGVLLLLLAGPAIGADRVVGTMTVMKALTEKTSDRNQCHSTVMTMTLVATTPEAVPDQGEDILLAGPLEGHTQRVLMALQTTVGIVAGEAIQMIAIVTTVTDQGVIQRGLMTQRILTTTAQNADQKGTSTPPQKMTTV